MTQEVSDERLGRFARQQNDWFRRVREGSLDPDEVAHAVQQIIDRPFDTERTRVDIFTAYLDDQNGVRQDVLAYVDMVIGMDAGRKPAFGPLWVDPTNERTASVSRIDEKYVNLVEARLALRNETEKESYRCAIRKAYSQKRDTEPNYDCMDNLNLVRAVTDLRLQRDVAGAGSLRSVLSSKTPEGNLMVNRIIEGLEKRGYSRTQAREAIERFCSYRK